MSALSKIKSAVVRAGKWLAGAVLVVVALVFGLLEQGGGGTSTPASTPAPAPVGSPVGASPADVAFAERASDPRTRPDAPSGTRCSSWSRIFPASSS